MNLNEKAEEFLETLWTHREKEEEMKLDLKSLKIDGEDKTIKTLLKYNLISVSGSDVALTERGEHEAERVVRRHRLAERLLVDVLDTEEDIVEEAACKFEHIIRSGIEESICVLLGHPRICPHGNPIPKGECCVKGYDRASRVVIPLSELPLNREGRIVYFIGKGRDKLQRLTRMGVTPGSRIQVIQSFPSYVFQIGQTQIAVDEEIANEIFVVQTV